MQVDALLLCLARVHACSIVTFGECIWIFNLKALNIIATKLCYRSNVSDSCCCYFLKSDCFQNLLCQIKAKARYLA